MESMTKDNNTGHNDIYQAYINQIKKIPLLTFEEELELSRRIQNGDDAARRLLVESNLRLVVKIAKTFYSREICVMDLIQEGNMGLLRAVEKYDHQKAVRFSTYSSWWICQSIARYLVNKRRLVRLPYRKEEMFGKIQQAYYALQTLNMRKPGVEEVAEKIGASKEDVDHVLGLCHDTVSLDGMGHNGESAGTFDFLEDHTYSPERVLLRKKSREAALEVLDVLKDRERNVLIYRYQLKEGKRYTLKHIGEKMGLSVESIRQIEFRALQKLRRHADELRDCIVAM